MQPIEIWAMLKIGWPVAMMSLFSVWIFAGKIKHFLSYLIIFFVVIPILSSSAYLLIFYEFPGTQYMKSEILLLWPVLILYWSILGMLGSLSASTIKAFVNYTRNIRLHSRER